MENKTDILNILEIKSDEPLIKDTQKLLKKMSKKEIYPSQIEKIKEDIKFLTEKKHHRIKEIYNNGRIDEEKLEFALKLVNKDKEIFKQLDEIKIKYKKEKTIKDLEIIKQNLEKTQKKLEENINIASNMQIKKKETIIEKIKNKINKTNQNKIQEQTDKIIQIIEQSKITSEEEKISENYFNLKEKYYRQEQLKETIDRLYKKCRLQDISNFQEIKKELQIKSNKIINNIENEIIKLKQETSGKKKYDERLVEYVYDKQKNYISHSIDHSDFNSMYVHMLTIINFINILETKNNKLEIIQTKINENQQTPKKKI